MHTQRQTLAIALALIAVLLAPVTAAFAQPRNPLEPRDPRTPLGPEGQADEREQAIADFDHRIEVIERRLAQIHEYVVELRESGAREEAEEFQIVADALELALGSMREERDRLERGEPLEFWLELRIDPEAQARIDKLESEVAQLRRQIDEAYAGRNAQLALELEHKLADVEAQLQDARDALHAHGAHGFAAPSDAHAKQIRELQMNIATLDSRIAEIEVKLLRARMGDDPNEEEVRKLANEIEELRTKRTHLQDKLTALSEEHGSFSPFGTRLNEEQLRLQLRLRELDAEIARLEELADNVARLGRVDEARQLMGRLDELRAEQDELARKLERAFSESQSHGVQPDRTRELEKLEQLLAVTRARLDETHARLDQIAAQTEEARARGDMDAVRELEAQFERVAAEAKLLSAELERLEAALEFGPDGTLRPHHQDGPAGSKKEIERLRTQIAELEAHVAELLAAWAEAQARGEEARIEELKTACAELLREIDDLKAELDRLTRDRR